jgi:transposase
MKDFIQWIYFDNENISKFIRNNANNENWPIAKVFNNLLEKEFKPIINKQIKTVQKYLKHLKNKRLGDNYFLIKAKNEIANEIKSLRNSNLSKLEKEKELDILKEGYKLKTYEDLML